MHIAELTALARQMQASDIHISEGLPLAFRIHGRLEPAPVQPSAAESRALILGMLDDAGRESWRRASTRILPSPRRTDCASGSTCSASRARRRPRCAC